MFTLGNRGLGLALLVAAAATSTGCMYTPGHNEHIGSRSDKVSFGGALTEPGKWVVIQAKHPRSGWQTLGYAQTGTYPFQYSETDWYLWSKKLAIPHSYWRFEPDAGTLWKADVRAVDWDSGDSLFTFEAGFFSYFDINEPVDELWEDHGHSTSVTIRADGFY